MTDYFVGEIRMVAFVSGRVPNDWLLCDGSVKNISEYQVLYSLIGTTYGGNGVNTFGLPDLRGRLPVGQGTGTGMTTRTLGQTPGTETVSLVEGNIPVHTHTFSAIAAAATTPTLTAGGVPFGFGATTAPTVQYMKAGFASTEGTVVALSDSMVDVSGGGNTAHNNVMPCAPVMYIICQRGLYPSRAN